LKKIESNSKLSDTKTEKLVAIYWAVKELVEEKLKLTSVENIVK
jgi:hypothetical protein